MVEERTELTSGDIGSTLAWLNRVINNNTAILEAKKHFEVFQLIKNSQIEESKALAEIRDSVTKAREELNNLTKVRDSRLAEIQRECNERKTTLTEEVTAEIDNLRKERDSLNPELTRLPPIVTGKGY